MAGVNRRDTYPLGDRVPGHELARDIRAQWRGEFRAPKQGEWYLSGAEIAAYRARYDLTERFHIAYLVRTRQVTRTEIIGNL